MCTFNKCGLLNILNIDTHLNNCYKYRNANNYRVYAR